MRSVKRRGRLALSCGIPEDVLLHGARVTWFARGSVLVEGQHGVVELTRERIRLKTQDGVLTVSGTGLALKELSADAAMIRADNIDTLTYLGPKEAAQR